ncbi:MAG: hypothetical protein AB7F75_02385 [Planctomycetota bacterium]
MNPFAVRFRFKALGILWFLMLVFVLQPLAGAWHVAGHDSHSCDTGHTHSEGRPSEGDSNDSDSCSLCQAFAAAVQSPCLLTEVPSWQFQSFDTVSTAHVAEVHVATQRLPNKARAPPCVA